MITKMDEEICDLLRKESAARKAHAAIVKQMMDICERRTLLNPTMEHKPQDIRNILLLEIGDTYVNYQNLMFPPRDKYDIHRG